jgi:hypothetical protein
VSKCVSAIPIMSMCSLRVVSHISVNSPPCGPYLSPFILTKYIRVVSGDLWGDMSGPTWSIVLMVCVMGDMSLFRPGGMTPRMGGVEPSLGFITGIVTIVNIHLDAPSLVVGGRRVGSAVLTRRGKGCNHG